MSPPRKSPGSEGLALPELMAQLGITSWTSVPNAILERWMAPDNPPRLRVMAALVRHSFGFQSPYAVHVVKGRQQPLYQADLARMLKMHRRWVKRLLSEVRAAGLIKCDGKLLYPVPRPPEMGAKSAPFAFSSRFAPASPLEAEAEGLDDPEYLNEVAQIKRDYLREIAQAKGRMAERLALARARARQRAMGADFAPILGADLTPILLSPPPLPPLSEKIKEKKGAGGQAARVETEEVDRPPAGPPAFPSPKVEELHRYLESIAHLVGTAPTLAEAAEIHKRLKPATIDQFRTHIENRLARGFRPRGWAIFHELAADCAKAPTAQGATPDARTAKLLQLQRALGFKP